MQIDRDNVIVYRTGGTGSLASIDDNASNLGIGRYWLGKEIGGQRGPWVLGAISLSFFGSTTGTATLNVYRQYHVPTDYLTDRLASSTARGVAAAEGDADYALRIADEDQRWYWFDRDEDLVLTWTNPGTIPWSLRIMANPVIE